MSRNINLAQIGYINRKINSSIGLSDLLNSILDITRDILEAEGSSLLLCDQESDDLIFNVVVGDKGNIIRGERVPKGKGIAGLVASSGKPMIVNDVANDERHFKQIDDISSFKTRNLICVPMKVIDRLVGVVEVVNSIGRNGFDDFDVDMLSYIADQAAIAINNRMLCDNLQARVDELASLYEISQALASSSSEHEVYGELLANLTLKLGVEKGSVVLFDSEKNSLVLHASIGLPDDICSDAEIAMHESISGYVYKTGDPIIVSDIDRELSFPFIGSRSHYSTKSFISIPIRYKEKVVGVINMADKKSNLSFDAFDLRLFSTVSAHVAEVYENLKNQKSLEMRRRLEQEIDIASQIQQKILPRIPENVMGHMIAAYNKPAKEVGGDFYDFAKVSDSKYSALVADVSGKGIPAALFVGSSLNIVRAEGRINRQPSNLLHSSNSYIYKDSENGMFITMFYILVDVHNRLITYSCAGHNRQMLFKAKSSEVLKLKASGKPLGLFADSEYEERVAFYEDGDILLLFTDGLLEFLGGEDIDEGERRLEDIINKRMNMTPSEIVGEVQRMIDDMEGHADFIDDITIMVIKF